MIQSARMPYVRFDTEVVTSKDDQGHTVYGNKIMAYITSAGSKDELVKDADEWVNALREKSMTRGPFDSAANEYDAWYDRFSKMLQSYKDGNGMDHDGTPLRASLAFSPAEVAQCEAVKIFTLESLSVCNEESISRMGMGGRALKQKAEKILLNSEGSKVAEENAALRIKIDELTAKVEQLASQLTVSGDETKKRGRPRADAE